MTDTTGPGRDGKLFVDRLKNAEATARRNGLPGFSAWRSGLERRYTVMPRWYWNEQECRLHYISHVQAAIDWQDRERRISRGASEFQRSLTRHI